MAQRLPRPVSIASYLLVALAAVALIDVAISASALLRVAEEGPRFLASPLAQPVADPELVVETTRQGLGWNAALAGAILVVFGVLGLLIRRPYAAARNLVWISGSVALFVLSCGVTVNPDYAAPADGAGSRWWSITELGLIPAWHSGVRSALTAVELALLILGCLQLLRPGARDHYRRQTSEISLGAVFAQREERLKREGA
ncbi:hypothetical protein [Catellatospora bangladeshensis]|uniref:Uncharacterized protein n=1 Tax=Catellatospora bangladeshensis TaxID=310355 RepID=A0A8J3JHF3_9ACTN|nr:hypothetical protein [Catellatospora bangladeshensis]GIF84932.1 hypothetical protein Cba03nite_62810 [Catellatospora bangladeshensis]